MDNNRLEHPEIRIINDTGYPSWINNIPVAGHCAVCGGDILHDDTCYNVPGVGYVCQGCMDDCKTTLYAD